MYKYNMLVFHDVKIADTVHFSVLIIYSEGLIDEDRKSSSNFDKIALWLGPVYKMCWYN